MTPIERFKAVCHFEKPDYVATFGLHGAPGMSHGAMRKTHERLVETGMPDWVDGCHSLRPNRRPNRGQVSTCNLPLVLHGQVR